MLVRDRLSPHYYSEVKRYEGNGLDLLFSDWCSVADMSRQEVRDGLALERTAMALVKQWADNHGAILTMVLFPTKEITYWKRVMEINPPWVNHCDVHEQYVLVSELARQLGIPVLDLVSPLKEAANSGQQLYYSNDHHFNPAGNQLAFTIILEALIKQNLVSGFRRP